MVNILWGQKALLSSQSSLIYIGFGAPMRLLRIHAVLLNPNAATPRLPQIIDAL
jgi:hypothetical protein